MSSTEALTTKVWDHTITGMSSRVKEARRAAVPQPVIGCRGDGREVMSGHAGSGSVSEEMRRWSILIHRVLGASIVLAGVARAVQLALGEFRGLWPTFG
jgi:hypothetical protein